MLTFRVIGGIFIFILVKKLLHKRTAATAKGKSNQASSSTQGRDSSSSSFPSSGWDYEVFLSFRGEDTRKSFTDHLYNALVNSGIHTFRDNEKLRIGEKIQPALCSAIHQSKIAIPIFSKDYASSKWCLRELAEIVECNKQGGQRQITVMPIFYHVDSSDVRHQTGSYDKAFRNHEKKFDHETIKEWKKALREVGELKGWELEKIADGHEGKLIKLIVKEVWSKLRKNPLTVSDNLVGIHSHVEEMMKLLNIISDDVRIVGIHGLGGIGKTTIARYVYNTVYHHFEGCSFIADARETFRTRGPIHLQSQLVMNILNLENPNITSVDQGIDMIKKRLSNKKVLIVLDDVDQNIDLNAIIGKRNWFGFGSRIIITTRDRHILDVCGVDRTYEPKEMDCYHSLRLFSKHAFKMDRPPEHYLALSKDVVETTGGLPLALEVIGSSLFGRGELLGKDIVETFDRKKLVWKAMVEKLKKIPKGEVQKRLRISYDELEYEQQQMFLDIACFFIGINKNIVCYIWHGCDFFPELEIDVLLLKSLVKIGENNELNMHDQLRDLGREIVRQENLKELGERSRLWSHDAVEVLSTQMGTRKVEGLSIVFSGRQNIQCLMSEGFSPMTKLRLLQADYAGVAGNFIHSFSELRWLSWKGCPIQFTPTNPKKLVVLDLSHSDITESWMGWNYIKVAKTLKVLNLSKCNKLSRTPDFSANLHLEVLVLNDCQNLAAIDSSIGHLKRLVILNMRGCLNLTYLPTSICELNSLKRLDLEWTRISQLPEKFSCMEGLTELNVNFSRVRLPNSIGLLRNLKTLSAANCNIQQGEIPDAIGRLSSLELLSLGRNRFHSLPAMVSNLTMLQKLSLDGCTKLQSLPELPSSLKSLNARDSAMKSLPWLSNLTNLEVLHLDYCKNLVEIPITINALTRLESLSLKGCCALQYIPHLPSALASLDAGACENVREISGFSNLTNLEVLHLDYCTNLVEIPITINALTRLESLSLKGCRALQYIPHLPSALASLDATACENVREISGFSDMRNLRVLHLDYCTNLVEIPITINVLTRLESLSLKGCLALQYIPHLPSALASLDATACENVREISGFSDMRNLVEVRLNYCNRLAKIESLEGLDSLQQLMIDYCGSLTKLPKLRGLEKLSSLTFRNVGLSEIEGFEGLYSLKRLIIQECLLLRKIPNLSYLKNLVCIEIRYCDELSEIEGLEGLYSLEKLIIHECHLLRKIPNLSYLKNLVCIDIRYCNELSEIEGAKGLYSLKELIIDNCHLRKIPNLSDSKNLVRIDISSCHELSKIEGLEGLESLEQLYIMSCHSLRNIQLPKNLSKFDISDCEKLSEIEGLEDLEALTGFHLSGCKTIIRLSELSNLKILKYLHITGITMLQEIGCLEGLESLEELNIFNASSLKVLPDLSTLKNLKHLELFDCMERLPGLSNLNKLKSLRIEACGKLTEIPSVDKLESLEVLRVCGCKSIERLPDLSNLTKLWKLHIKHCEKLTEIEGVDRLEILEILCIDGCISIESFPCLSSLKNLKTLTTVNCKKLTKIQGADVLESLEELNVRECISIETLPCLSNLKNLKILSAVNCKKVTEIQGVDELESLVLLNVRGCISIETLPSLSKLKKLRILSVVNCKNLTEIQGADQLESLEELNVHGCISMSLPDLSSLRELQFFIGGNSNENSSSRKSYSELEIWENCSASTIEQLYLDAYLT